MKKKVKPHTNTQNKSGRKDTKTPEVHFEDWSKQAVEGSDGGGDDGTPEDGHCTGGSPEGGHSEARREGGDDGADDGSDHLPADA